MRVSHGTLALQRNLELRQRLKLRSRLGCDALHQRGRGYPMMPETVRHDGDPITQWNPGGPSAVLPHPHSLLSHEAST
jgi:hypothetical protein